MRFQPLPLVALAGAATAASNSTNGTTSTEPCALISEQVVEFYSNETNAKESFIFRPSHANACLQTAGINQELAYQFVIEYKKYLEFQTTLAYLKDPPSDYPYAPTDILGGLDALASKIAAGGYTSQYAVDQELNRLVASAYEGHLYASFCSLQAISYQRNFGLVSLSIDGIELPELYMYQDFAFGAENASSVVTINGQNATEVIEQEGLFQAMDPDAAYNYLMASQGRVPSSGQNIGYFTALGGNFYPGDYTNVTFSNGTTRSFENLAIIQPETWDTRIQDGDDFAAAFCIIPALPEDDSSSSSASATATATPAATSSATASASPTAFPQLFPYTPVALDPNNQVAGYFLNGSDYADTAVLWVATFSQQNERYADSDTIATSFQNTTRDFFDAVRAEPRITKLIIDVTGNPGGNTLLPDDLFKRLFPSIEPYGAARFRIPVAGDIWGQTLANLPEDLVVPTPEMVQEGNFTDTMYAYYTSNYRYQNALTTNLQNFTGWSGPSGLYPPNVEKGDNFTANYRTPLNNSLYDFATDSINVYGFNGSMMETEPQPFLAENIVILTDGLCASACSILTELLTRQANIKTIAVGGRPRNAPMQAIGGTKGSLALGFDGIQLFSQAIYNASDYFPTSTTSTTTLEIANSTSPGLNPLPLGPNNPTALKSYSINGADNIPQGDDVQIPLQFVFEAANCRIFYTPATAGSQSSLWEMVSGIAWKGVRCSWGSMDTVVGNNGTGSGSGNGTLPGQSANGAGRNGVLGMGAMVVAGLVAMMLL